MKKKLILSSALLALVGGPVSAVHNPEALKELASKNISRRITSTLQTNSSDMKPFFDLISVKKGKEERSFLPEDLLEVVVPYQVARTLAEKLVNSLQSSATDMEPALNILSIKEDEKRVFLPPKVLASVFAQVGYHADTTGASAFKLLNWANEGPMEPARKAVQDGFLQMQLEKREQHDSWTGPLTLRINKGHLFGSFDRGYSQQNPLFFQLSTLKDRGLPFDRLDLNRGYSGSAPSKELQEVFTTSSLTSFQLEGCSFDTLDDFEVLFPLSSTASWLKLRELTIMKSDLGVAVAIHLAQYLSLPHSGVEVVKMSYGGLQGNEQVVAFLKTLSPTTKLSSLSLQESNINHLGGGKVGQAIPASIVSLDLGGNYNMGDEGVNDLVTKLQTKNVRDLVLTNTNITDGARLGANLQGTKVEFLTLTLESEQALLLAKNLPSTVTKVAISSLKSETQEKLKKEYPHIEWIFGT